MKGARIIAVVISLVLVVGLCIGVIIAISRRNSAQEEDDELSTRSKAVAAVCSPTDYKQVCLHSVRPVAKNQTSTPKDFIQAAITSTIDVMKEAVNNSGTIFNTNIAGQKMAKKDCEDLLNFAIKDLQDSYAMVEESELRNINDSVAELKNWLSGVISYQQACLDGVSDPALNEQMKQKLLNATELTSNALAIVSGISGILNTFNISTTMRSSSMRRLLGTATAAADGGGGGGGGGGGSKYPAWLSAADRKLLSSENDTQVKPDVVVAKDGSGNYTTIADALAAYPKDLKGRYVIYVKEGIYDEYLTVTPDQVNVFMYGDGAQKTIITGNKCYRDGVSIFRSATFSAEGNGFMAKSIGFQNTAGPEGHQAVALRVQSDMAAFHNCRIDGYQDTLYAQAHRQFYRNCVISGTVDFIFGDSTTMIQNSLIIARKPMEGQQITVMAQGRSDKRETTGFVLHDCRIVPEKQLYPVRFKIPSFLGRPWKEYSRTVIMESTMGDFIKPAGYMPWNGNFALDTLFFAEYENQGPGAETENRVNWGGFKVIKSRNEALPFTAGPFVQGHLWLKFTGAPYFLGLKN